MNITTATPVEIDTRLAAIYTEVATQRGQRERAQELLGQIEEVQGTSETKYYSWCSDEKRDEALVVVAAADEKIAALTDEAQPMEGRYRAERWTRFYLVTNTGGHVHWSTGCDTCFPTTQFAWMTDQSGMAHADLVEMAGSMACTVCFPDAPVDVLRRKSTLEAPERKAARLEREAKRAAKTAAEIFVPNYVTYGGRSVRSKTFKTARAVTNDIAGNLSSLVVYGEGHPSANEWTANITACRAALDAKGIAYDYDKALTSARKRIVREGCAARF